MCLSIVPVSAEDTTIVPTIQKTIEAPIIQKVSMYIYGDVSYLNGVPVPAGSVIIAKDQLGTVIAKYTIRKPGKIGSEIGYNDRFTIDVWRNQSDKANRTRPVFLAFNVGGVLARDILEFRQNDNVRFDLVIQSLPTDAIIEEPTTLVTSVPSGVRTLPTPPIVSTITGVTTPVSTQPPITQTQSPQPQPTITSQTPIPTATQQQPPEDNTQYIYYGIVGTIIIIMGIIISGIIYSYLMSKTSRDEILQPDGKWKGK
jgi:hypothetical protein